MSKITFYRTDLTPEKNAWIEDLHEYLVAHAIQTYQRDNIQYQKIGLNISVVVPADQLNVGDQRLGNYCELEQDNRIYDFFIVSVNWKSKGAVEVRLSLDTINTYGEELVFAPQTTIQRQHGNRFLAADNTKTGEKTLLRTIDRQPENLTLPKELVLTQDVVDNNGNFNWFLMYKTRDNLTPDNTANPIECGLVADVPLTIQRGHADLPTLEALPTFFEPGPVYFFDPLHNPKGKITFKADSEISSTTITLADMSANTINVVGFQIVSGRIAVFEYIYDRNGPYWTAREGSKGRGSTGKINFIQSSSLQKLEVKTNSFTEITTTGITVPAESGSIDAVKTIPYSAIDKTNSRLMKIIRLPYCPFDIVKNANGEFVLPNEWIYSNRILKLKDNDLSKEFLNKIAEIDLTNQFRYTNKVEPLSPRANKAESKMFNSEFYTYKFVYDSFVKEVELEKFDVARMHQSKMTLPIYFKPTNTVNSKFAFKFETSYSAPYAKIGDYEDYLIINRNNEETIFSNDYINYIRNGYNYDKKQRDRQVWNDIGGILLGGIQSRFAYKINKGESYNNIYSYIAENPQLGGNENTTLTDEDIVTIANRLAGRTAGSSFLTVAALNAGFNAVNQGINTLNNYISANQAIQQKKAELSAQSSQVQGADDVDLLQYYNGNRLEIKTYELEKLSKHNIENLFHYGGYSHLIQEVPNIKSRYWFNYIQCVPVFKHEGTTPYDAYLTDIKARFSQGITVFHHHPEVGIGWNIEQDLENWETNILNTSYLPTTKLAIGATDFTLSEELVSWTNISPITNDERLEFHYLDGWGDEHTEIASSGNELRLDYLDTQQEVKVRRISPWNEKINSDWVIIN